MTEENKKKWLAIIASKRLGWCDEYFNKVDGSPPYPVRSGNVRAHYSCDICKTNGDLLHYEYAHAVIVNICKKHARELDLIW